MLPRKHHYIPIFYLKRWAGADGRVCEYSKPFRNKVVPRRVHPAGTGYTDRLYELRGLPADVAQVIEDGFFKAVDVSAAEALALLDKGLEPSDVRLRSAWTRFILSLLLRCPEDLEHFRMAWPALLSQTDEASERSYQELRGPDDPQTLAEFITADPSIVERSTFSAFVGLIDNQSLGSKINSYAWQVLELPSHCDELFTSDRPVIRTNGLLAENGHLALPIGPRKLFVCSPHPAVLKGLENSDASELAREVNRQVVEYAVRYVYGTTDRSLRYVQNRMAKRKQPRLAMTLTATSGSDLLAESFKNVPP